CVPCAMLYPTARRLNAFALLQGMRAALRGRGVVVHEHTPVLRVAEGKTIVLTTPRGEVRARAVVLATNGYTPALGYFQHEILPLHSHVIATGPLSNDTWVRLGSTAWAGFTSYLAPIPFASRTTSARLLIDYAGKVAY